jgi:S-adenosyl-L-methionine hydrolase (adenosine-forming)
VALRAADGRIFVGPDNGLLIPAAEACGGIVEAHEIANPDVMLHPVSRTFHARDIFSPAAGRLAGGLPLAEVGPELDPADLVRRVGLDHVVDGTLLRASVQHVDRFGNIQLAVFAAELDGLFEPGRLAEVVTPDDRYYVRCAETFADVEPGELVIYMDSSGLISVAVNQGSAAELTAMEAGAEIGVEFSPSRRGRGA